MDHMRPQPYFYDPKQFKEWHDSQRGLNEQDYPAAKNGGLKTEEPLTRLWQMTSWVTGYSNESMEVSRSVAAYLNQEISDSKRLPQGRVQADTLKKLEHFKVDLHDGAERLTLGRCYELSRILDDSYCRDLQKKRGRLVSAILEDESQEAIKVRAKGVQEYLRRQYTDGNIGLESYCQFLLEEPDTLETFLTTMLPDGSLRPNTGYSENLKVAKEVFNKDDLASILRTYSKDGLSSMLSAYRKVRAESIFTEEQIRQGIIKNCINRHMAEEINQGNKDVLEIAVYKIMELVSPSHYPTGEPSASSCLLPEAHHLPDVAEENVDRSDAPTLPIGVSGEAQTFSEESTFKIHYPPVSSGPERGALKDQHSQYDNDQPSAAKAMVEGNPESQSRQWHEMESLVASGMDLHGAARDFQTNDPLVHAQPSLESASNSSGHSFPEPGALAAVVTNSQQRELFVSDEEKRIAFENFKKDSLAKKYSFDDMMRAIELLGPDYLIRARDNDTLAILEIAFKCMDQPSSRVNSQGGCRWTSDDSPEVVTTPSTNPSVPALTDDHHLATQQSSNQLPDLCSEIETKSTQAAAGNNDLLQVYPQSTPETDEHVAQPLLEPSREAGYGELSQDTNMPEELMDLITTNRDLKELSREGIQRAWDEKMIDEQTIRLLSNKSNCAQAVLMLRANITHCIEKSKKAEPLAGVSQRPGTFEIPPKIAARGRELGVERADMTYSFMEGIQKDLEEENDASGGAVLGMQDGLHSSHENIQLPEPQQTEEHLQQIWKHFNKKYPEYSFEHVKEALQISPLSHNDYHAARVGLDNGLEEVALACVLLNTSGQSKVSGVMAEPQALELQQKEEYLPQIWEHFSKKHPEYSFEHVKEALQMYPLSDDTYRNARAGLDRALQEVVFACVMLNTSGQSKAVGVMAKPQALPESHTFGDVTLRRNVGIQARDNNCCFASFFMAASHSGLMKVLISDAKARRDELNSCNELIKVDSINRLIAILEHFHIDDVVNTYRPNDGLDDLRELYNIIGGGLDVVLEVTEFIFPMLQDIYGYQEPSTDKEKAVMLDATRSAASLRRKVGLVQVPNPWKFLGEASSESYGMDNLIQMEELPEGLNRIERGNRRFPWAPEKMMESTEEFLDFEGCVKVRLITEFDFQTGKPELRTFEYLDENKKVYKTVIVHSGVTPDDVEIIRSKETVDFIRQTKTEERMFGYSKAEPNCGEIKVIEYEKLNTIQGLFDNWIDSFKTEYGERLEKVLPDLLPDRDNSPEYLLVPMSIHDKKTRTDIQLKEGAVSIPMIDGGKISYELSAVMAIDTGHYTSWNFEDEWRGKILYGDSVGSREADPSGNVNLGVAVPLVISMPTGETNKALDLAYQSSNKQEDAYRSAEMRLSELDQKTALIVLKRKN